MLTYIVIFAMLYFLLVIIEVFVLSLVISLGTLGSVLADIGRYVAQHIGGR